MINEQLTRILSSKPQFLIKAIQSNHQQLLTLETLLQQRGKQVNSLQEILSNEVGLTDKIIHTKEIVIDLQQKVKDARIQIENLKTSIKKQIKKSYGDLMGEIAKIFKQLCVDKKDRVQQINTLKEEVERLKEEIKLRSHEIILIDQESFVEDEMRECRIPMLDTGGYTLGNESLKQVFSPINGSHLLSLSEIKNLKERLSDGIVSKNPKNGKREVFYEKGYSFKGSFQNGQRHGFGQLICKNQVIYRGDWKRDIFWGKGTLQLKQISTPYDGACLYMGNFQNGQFHGLGVIQFQDGTRFTSQFSKGRVSSPGVLKKHEYMSIVEYQHSMSLNSICTK